MMETFTISPQIVKDEVGNELGVFLPIAQFQKLLDDLEELEDIKAADVAMNRLNQEFIPIQQALDEIKNGTVR